ncbi:MAG: sigma-70 family RNA polymerase sigma factor [Oscillospiraceae bacterium]|nr:sigma-70 family RNA polymerase sigma factor [Oscillospiraceae bacterium]
MQMLNEELVAVIQAGEDHMGELWIQVEGLVTWAAKHRIAILEGRCGVEFEDLYQSGYPALVAAVYSYKPGNGAFSTWFMLYLRTAFAEATGFRTVKQKLDPLNTALSLDAPLGDDADSTTFEDITADPRAAAYIENVEETVWREQLHDTLESALAGLPEDQSRVLRMRYYEGRTCASIVEDLDCTAAGILDKEQRALKKLHDARYFNGLSEYVEKHTNYYQQVGLNQFKRTGFSAVETIVMRREKLAEKWLKKKLHEMQKEMKASDKK